MCVPLVIYLTNFNCINSTETRVLKASIEWEILDWEQKAHTHAACLHARDQFVLFFVGLGLVISPPVRRETFLEFQATG